MSSSVSKCEYGSLGTPAFWLRYRALNEPGDTARPAPQRGDQDQGTMLLLPGRQDCHRAPG